MDELKPCPFCGGKPYLETRHRAFIQAQTTRVAFVRCTECNARTQRFELQSFGCTSSSKEANKKAIEAWNSRVVGKTNMPMGSLTYAIACRICKNRDSDKCAACKMEIQSGFELDEDAFKEALVDG